MTTTPPVTERARTPQTPLHGPKYDTPRRSSRIHTKQMHSPHGLAGSPPNPRTRTIRPISSQTLSPPSSPSTPGHRVTLSRTRLNKHRHDLHPESTSLGVVPFGGRIEAEMLPTPAKTPRKRPAVAESQLSTTARVLFNEHPIDPEDIMPTPRKSRKGKKHIAFSLESFEQEKANGEHKVAIFTDSKERMPEIDEDEDNPFLVRKGKKRMNPSRTSYDRQSSSRLKHGMTKEVDEAVENGHGMVYTFRGKKLYRPFTDAKPEEAEPEEDELAGPVNEQDVLRHQSGATSRRPFTRSSIKPRLLFPPAVESQVTTDLAAEEADTDIEPNPTVAGLHTASETEDADMPTPTKGHFLPMTPPTTNRKKKPSPFDSWSRVKPGRRTVSAKRQGEALEKDEGTNRTNGKRSRSAQAGSGGD